MMHYKFIHMFYVMYVLTGKVSLFQLASDVQYDITLRISNALGLTSDTVTHTFDKVAQNESFAVTTSGTAEARAGERIAYQCDFHETGCSTQFDRVWVRTYDTSCHPLPTPTPVTPHPSRQLGAGQGGGRVALVEFSYADRLCDVCSTSTQSTRSWISRPS